jgi:hypothetical protein
MGKQTGAKYKTHERWGKMKMHINPSDLFAESGSSVPLPPVPWRPEAEVE